MRKTLCHHIIYETWNPSSHTGLTCMYILTITRAGEERNVQGGSLGGELQKACWKSLCAQQVRARKPSQAQGWLKRQGPGPKSSSLLSIVIWKVAMSRQVLCSFTSHCLCVDCTNLWAPPRSIAWSLCWRAPGWRALQRGMGKTPQLSGPLLLPGNVADAFCHLISATHLPVRGQLT